jgi:hypothetical protein
MKPCAADERQLIIAVHLAAASGRSKLLGTIMNKEVRSGKSHDAWKLFQTYAEGRRLGLPRRHLKPEDVSPAWVGRFIFVEEHAPELPRDRRLRNEFNKNFNATISVYNAATELVGRYQGSVGSQFKWDAGGLRSGLYGWKTGMHGVSGDNPEPYAALHILLSDSRRKMPMVGKNNNPNSSWFGKKHADWINFHASGKRTRSSQGCLNIDRTDGKNENYLKFMSHFPRGATGSLFVSRNEAPIRWGPIYMVKLDPLDRVESPSRNDGLLTRRRARRSAVSLRRSPLA